jgi:AcrR family transcriptional regulator
VNEQVRDDDHDVELPASLALAWGVRERPAKGPKRGLSLDRIVAAAVKAADADGLEAVSMSRVAVDLGAATMSLYRYVASKDELLVLMIDLATGQPPTDPVTDWRVGLTRWAEAYRAVLNRHDWILRLPAEGLPIAPHQTAWLERGLQSLQGASLREAEKLSTVLLIRGFVRNEAVLTAGAPGRDAAPAYGRVLSQLTDRFRFPALHQAIAAGAFETDDDVDSSFYFGLERILDGIDVLTRMGSRLNGD